MNGVLSTWGVTVIWKHRFEVLSPLSLEWISVNNTVVKNSMLSSSAQWWTYKETKKNLTFKLIHKYSFKSFNLHLLFLLILYKRHNTTPNNSQINQSEIEINRNPITLPWIHRYIALKDSMLNEEIKKLWSNSPVMMTKFDTFVVEALRLPEYRTPQWESPRDQERR